MTPPAQVYPATAAWLKRMVVEATDLLEQARHKGDNVLPFTPLERLLIRRPIVLHLANWLEKADISGLGFLKRRNAPAVEGAAHGRRPAVPRRGTRAQH